MSETQFISHTQTVSPTLVPRRGVGFFGAIIIVIAILGGALTGGLVLLEKNLKGKVDEAKARLGELKDSLEISSIKEASQLQRRIEAATALLARHTYASQAFNFVERNTLDPVTMTSFSYADGKIKMDARAPGYSVFAGQIQYYRTLSEIKDFTFQNPTLGASGEVSFTVEITLSGAYLAKPEKALPVVSPAPVPTSDDSTTTSNDTGDEG